MKLNTAIPKEAEKARSYLDCLLQKKSLVEVKRLSPTRSLSQNAYLHLTFQIFAVQYGEPSVTAVKSIHYKKYANPDIYIAKSKEGDLFLRSSADLTVEETTRSIENWRAYAGENGIDIPLPGDEEKLRYYENEIEKEGRW
jgi:hypothetical protein